MELQTIGRILIAAAIILGIAGLALIVLGNTPFGTWLRSLPGTLRVQAGNVTCLFPIVFSILLSIVLTIVLNIIIRIINRP
ncbi:DUF2905 domain-containing protein [Anaerolineae bacterium CFX9]|jgi:hypothetical protein|nr:DUF2905 family protein [Kamptonema cortianum]MDL1902974.1 DUF2905 domain-containing protein [Anaerolineae bacterium CFX9]